MTNEELLRESFLLAKVTTQGIPLTAEMAQDGLSAMNDMLAEWDVDSIDTGYYPQTSLAAESPIYADSMSAVKYNLAIRLCAMYELEPSATLVAVAMSSYKRLERESVTGQMKEADLSHLPGVYEDWTIESFGY